jgi:hypothetical protein
MRALAAYEHYQAAVAIGVHQFDFKAGEMLRIALAARVGTFGPLPICRKSSAPGF